MNISQKEEKREIFKNQFLVTNDFNRMGCKLSGETIKCDIDGIISEGIALEVFKYQVMDSQ